MIKVILSRALGERRITRDALHKMTGIRSETISEYYHDLNERINLDYLDRICKALDCEITDILEKVDDDAEYRSRRRK